MKFFVRTVHKKTSAMKEEEGLSVAEEEGVLQLRMSELFVAKTLVCPHGQGG